MRRQLIAGNWKMHGTLESARRLAGHLRRLAGTVEIAVFVPAVHVTTVCEELAGCGIRVGVQTVHPAASGAHSGEVSAEMARDAGATMTLVGHSERRIEAGESPGDVARRFEAALRAGLEPVLCVGEQSGERDAGQAGSVVRDQLAAVLERVGVDGLAAGCIAYEPVWAIGTGRTATPQVANGMHALIRAWLDDQRAGLGQQVTVVYGGSVNAQNAPALLAEPDIDGALVGGASLDADAFRSIVAAAAEWHVAAARQVRALEQ